MNSIPTPFSSTLQDVVVTVPLGDRWLVRDRLQELDILCHCEVDGSLRLAVTSAQSAIQVWSVLFRWTGSRLDQVDWLERCYLGH